MQTQSETRKASLSRPEQVFFAEALLNKGIFCVIEKKVLRAEFYCKKHSAFPVENIGEIQTVLCPVCRKECQRMFYLLDVFLPKFNLDIEIDGGIHHQRGQGLRDHQKDKFLRSTGIQIVRFPSEIFLDSKGKLRYDCIEALAEMIGYCDSRVF